MGAGHTLEAKGHGEMIDLMSLRAYTERLKSCAKGKQHDCHAGNIYLTFELKPTGAYVKTHNITMTILYI